MLKTLPGKFAKQIVYKVQSAYNEVHRIRNISKSTGVTIAKITFESALNLLDITL